MNDYIRKITCSCAFLYVFFLLFNSLSLAGEPQLTAGGFHCLGVHKNGQVWAWGDNYDQMLGVNSDLKVIPPMQVMLDSSVPLAHIKSVAAGDLHSIALHSDGMVWTWGFNDYGQLGDGTNDFRPNPVQVMRSASTPLENIAAITAGDVHSVAVGSDGTVWTWGFNIAGQLGDGTYDSRDRPVQVMESGSTPLTGIVEAAAGYHTLALHNNGSIWAWGDNDGGQLGDGTTAGRNTPGLVMASGSTPFTGVQAVAASYNHSIALKEDGTVWAWGKNSEGQLGDGTETDRSNPVQVMLAGSSTPLNDVVAIEAGYDHNLALLGDGTVWAWGGNYFGQLGEGSTTDQSGAVQVMLSSTSPLSNIIAIAAGGEHSHALAGDGTVWSWGDNEYMQIGNGKLSASSYAVQASNMTDGVQVSGSYHSLAVRNDGTIRSWGRNNYGQLGDGSMNDRNIPVQSGTALPLSTVTQAPAGTFHSLAIQTEENNSLWSWGVNDYGQLGDGTQESQPTPVRVMLNETVPSEEAVTADAGNRHSVAILNYFFNGIIVAWGDNSYAQLGQGTTGGNHNYPVAVKTEPIGDYAIDFTDVAAGARHNIALHITGEVWAWGNNSDGQLGDLSTTQRTRAVKVQQTGATDLIDVVTIAAASFHNLIIKSNGNLLAWGRNANGQLGSGDLDNRLYAARVRASETDYFTGATAVAGGSNHSLALKTDGTVWAWGGNEHGQLGNGTYEDSLYPVQVMISATTPLTNVVAIGSGLNHSMAVLADGTVWTWGWNSYGQLGDGGRSWYPVKSLIKLPSSKWLLFLPAIFSGALQ